MWQIAEAPEWEIQQYEMQQFAIKWLFYILIDVLQLNLQKIIYMNFFIPSKHLPGREGLIFFRTYKLDVKNWIQLFLFIFISLCTEIFDNNSWILIILWEELGSGGVNNSDCLILLFI